MVDAGAGVGDFLGLGPDPPREHRGGALDAVAEAAGDQVGMRALDGAAEHGHRVGVVEVDGARAVASDVGGDFEDRVDGAQEAEDAAWSAGVADVGVDAVLLGDEDVVLPDVDAAVEDRGDDALRVLQRLAAVERGHDLGGVLAVRHNALAGAADDVEPFGVDVHQRDRGVGEGRVRQKVADEFAGEAEAAGSDEGYFV